MSRALFMALGLVTVMATVWIGHVELSVLDNRRAAMKGLRSAVPQAPDKAQRKQEPQDEDAAWHHKRKHRGQHKGHATEADVAKEAKHNKKRHHRKHKHPGHPGGGGIKPGDTVAFAVVVSNEEFVDGALTLAWSFKNHSKLFASGTAKLALIVPEGALCDESLKRLQAVGWKDQRLVPDLTKEAGKSVWAGTFNKLYLFNLTEYTRVAYFDVDMLMLRSPDDIFESVLPNNTYIGALGNSPHHRNGPYFQTGMMLIIPSEEAFEAMMEDFDTRPENKDVNGRDGVIIRRYYGDRYVNLDDALSSHLAPDEPLDGVIGFHFRGSWKPWFDRSKPIKEDPRKKKKVDREIGAAYYLWWSTYEHLHRTVLADLPLATGSRDPHHKVPVGYDAHTHVWLMRHTPDSYIQPLSSVATDSRNKTIRGLVLEVTLQSESCDFVCGLRQAVCVNDALTFTEVNNCNRLKALFGCSRCETASKAHPAMPALDIETHVCYTANPTADADHLPRCAEISDKHRRLCPCLPLERSAGRVEPVPFEAAGLHVRGDDTWDAEMVSALGGKITPKLPCDSRFTSTFGKEIADGACERHLAEIERRAAWVGALPMSVYAGVTMKLFAQFKDGTRAVVKLPQPGFPHEPQSEVAAYHVDRLFGFKRVPPTVHVWVSDQWLSKALANASAVGTPLATAAAGDAVPAGQPPAQTASGVLEYMRSSRALSRKVGKGTRQLAVSVQLWVDDVHRLADTSLAVSEEYEHWFAIGPTALRPTAADRDVADKVLPALSDMIVFDYIIDNADRGIAKNLFAAGGCSAYCVNSRLQPHIGEPSIVLLDQGHAFYDLEDKPTNVLAAAIADSKSATAFCRLRASTRERLEQFGATGDDAKDGESLAEQLSQRLKARQVTTVMNIIGEVHFAKMQARAVAAAKHFAKHCPATDPDTMLSDA
jgi:hypothetical protein